MPSSLSKEIGTFDRIMLEDINEFIRFLKEVRSDYPYRWFFDREWIRTKVKDSNFIWGILKKGKKIIGTIICYFEPSKKISILKLLLVHPAFRRKGILNNIFFERLQEKRIVEEIRSHHPNQLFAEILVNQHTSQKMVQRIGMAYCGYYPNKTSIDGIRASLIPCSLLFARDKRVILIDERIYSQFETILRINKLSKLRLIHKGKAKPSDNKKLDFSFNVTNTKMNKSANEVQIKIDDSNFLQFHFNSYLKNITEIRFHTKDPDVVQFFVDYLLKLDVNYLEFLIPPELWLQEILLRNKFKFVAFLPCFWGGEDCLVFSSWKHRPRFIPKMRHLYNEIMRVYA